MSTIGSGRQEPMSRLTKLYTDTKQSLQAALPTRTFDDLPEKQLLDRKYNTQKDRLIAWGLAWRDGYDSEDIDKSVEKAGLTEVVESVLESTKGVLDELERMSRPATTTDSPYPVEKATSSKDWTTSDLARYEGLIQSMTDAISLLCAVSEPAAPAPSDGISQKIKTDSKQRVYRKPVAQRPPSPVPAYSRSGSSSITRSSTVGDQTEQQDENNSSLTKIDPSLLVLPQEGPPTYGDSKTIMRGAAAAPIVFGHIRQAGGSLLPVMVEYARFDRVFRDAGMVLPLTRLDRLHTILGSWNAEPSSTLARPIAYFEDAAQPRYGLIYELPPAVKQAQQQTPSQMYPEEPATLSSLLHQTSKVSRDLTAANPPPPIPCLEERYRLAQQLVQGFSFLQQHDFPHRNVSSSSVALFLKGNRSSQPFDLRRPLICATDLFSDYDLDPPPEALQQNIYRHPDDPRIKGPTAAKEYDQRFDLYSLSLMLLEIGLWVPLAEIYKEKYSLKDFKLRVEKLWIKKEIPIKCGTLFARCVQDLCQASDLKQSPDSAATQRRMLDRVLTRLDKCCMIDEGDDDIDLDPPSNEDAAEAVAVEEGNITPTQYVICPPSPAATIKLTATRLSNDNRQPTLDSVSSWLSEEKGPEEKRKTPRNIFTDMLIPDHIQAEYESFENRLLRIVTLALKHTTESSWIDLHYSGETKGTSRPTICVGCTSTKRVRTAIKKNLHYNDNLFDLAVIKDAIRRSKSTGVPRRSQAHGDVAALNPGHHERPLCGSSIGAWRQCEHSPAVTFGGVVLVDGEPYGMTVHHLLENPEADEKPWWSKDTSTSSPDADEESDDEEDDTDGMFHRATEHDPRSGHATSCSH